MRAETILLKVLIDNLPAVILVDIVMGVIEHFTHLVFAGVGIEVLDSSWRRLKIESLSNEVGGTQGGVGKIYERSCLNDFRALDLSLYSNKSRVLPPPPLDSPQSTMQGREIKTHPWRLRRQALYINQQQAKHYFNP